MQRIIVTMMFIVLGISWTPARAADHRKHQRPTRRRAGLGSSWRHGHREEPSDRFDSNRDERRRRHLPADGASRGCLRRHRGAPGLQQGGEQRDRRQRRPDARREHDPQGREPVRDGHRHRREPAHRDLLVVCRRCRGHPADREPPAERASVREPRGDDSRRRPRIPLRPDEEHAVRAADQRRRRPQRELPDRRRRQQRRHRRRPAAGLPARSDPGIQLRDAALQGGIRPEQRRRHEHRDEERHEQSHGELLRVVPRQVDERDAPETEKICERRTSRTTAGTSSAAASAVRSPRTRPTSSARSSGRSRTRRRPSTRRGCSRRSTGLPPFRTARTW